MNVWQSMCRPGPAGWGGWREMQSACRLGGHGQGLPVFLTEKRFPAPQHIPALGWMVPCFIRLGAGTVGRVAPSGTHIAPTDGHRTWDGDASCDHFGPRQSLMSPSQAAGLQLALTLRPILLGCSIMGFVFGMALSGRGAASACPVNLVSWWVSG